MRLNFLSRWFGKSLMTNIGLPRLQELFSNLFWNGLKLLIKGYLKSPITKSYEKNSRIHLGTTTGGWCCLRELFWKIMSKRAKIYLQWIFEIADYKNCSKSSPENTFCSQTAASGTFSKFTPKHPKICHKQVFKVADFKYHVEKFQDLPGGHHLGLSESSGIFLKFISKTLDIQHYNVHVVAFHEYHIIKCYGCTWCSGFRLVFVYGNFSIIHKP